MTLSVVLWRIWRHAQTQTDVRKCKKALPQLKDNAQELLKLYAAIDALQVQHTSE